MRQIRSLFLQGFPDPESDRTEAQDYGAPNLANALSYHPSLEEFHIVNLSSEEIHVLTAILPTFPGIRKVTIICLSNRILAELNPESLSQLLYLPSLRELSLHNCWITQLGLCVIGDCLSNGSLISALSFEDCQLPGEGAASIATALGHNGSLKQLHFISCGPDPTFYSALQNGLSNNRTLAALTMNGVGMQIHDQYLCMAFEGLKTNQSLETLHLLNFSWTNVVSDVLRESLEENLGLQRLSIHGSCTSSDSWRRILPFLRVNSTLTSLKLEDSGITPTIIPDMVDALASNSRLRLLGIDSPHFSTAALVDLIGKLTSNVSLKELIVGYRSFVGLEYIVENAATADVVAAAKRNYGLEEMNVTVFDTDQQRLLLSIRRLNQAGRRYLIEDPTSKEAGYSVLFEVRNDLNCLFLHLQENPLLCSTLLTEDGRAPQPLASKVEEKDEPVD